MNNIPYEHNRLIHPTQKNGNFAYDILLISVNLKIANWSFVVIVFKKSILQDSDSWIKNKIIVSVKTCWAKFAMRLLRKL